MSRSNGPNLSTGGRPAPRSQASDPHWQGQPQYQPAHGHPQQSNAGHYQQGYAPIQPAPDPLASLAGYRYPQHAAAQQHGHDDPYARQPPAHGPTHGYGQQHDPYAAYAEQQPQNGYGNGYVAEPAPSPLSSGYPSGHQDLRGPAYDQWPQQGHSQQAHTQAYDNGYGRQQPQSTQGGYAPRQAAPQLSANDWPGADPYAAHSADPGFDLAGYGGPHANYDGYQQQSGALMQQYADEEDEEEDVEPPRRGRGRMIIMALIGAIGIGGGLAYGYKELLGSPSGTDSAPVVKSAAGPTKTKPTNPGGKQFAHADSKVLGRLGDAGSSADDNSPGRKVSTLSIARDGTIMVPTASASEASAPAPTPSSSAGVNVPGLMVVDPYGRSNQASAASAPSPTADKPLVVNPPAAPERPVVIAKATPSGRTATDADDSDRAPSPPAPPARKKTAPIEKAAMAVGAPPPATTGSAGYVAVLASVPASGSSRMQALKQFADMQQKYGSVLQNKTPDVQEANLGDKGTYHRLLVGPPASRDQASSLCSSLKAAGYNDCWVTGY